MLTPLFLIQAPDSRLLRRLPRVALQRVALFCGGNGTGRLTATCRALRDATRVRAWWLHFLYDEMQWAPGMVKSIRKKGARRKARVEQSWNARALCRQYARCHAHRSRLVMTQNSEYLARRKERMRYARHVQVIRRGIAALARVGTLSRLPDDPQYRLPLHLIADAGVRVEDLYEGVRIEDESDGRGVERINLEGFIVDTVEPPESEADSHSSGESDDDGRSHLDLDGGGLDGNSESDERGDDDRADGAKDDPPSITGPLPEGLRTLLVRVLQRRLAQRFNRMAAARGKHQGSAAIAAEYESYGSRAASVSLSALQHRTSTVLMITSGALVREQTWTVCAHAAVGCLQNCATVARIQTSIRWEGCARKWNWSGAFSL